MTLTRKQFVLFSKMLASNLVATIGDNTFKIEQRINDLYELNQYFEGRKTLLFAGTIRECIDTAKDCVNMIYNVTD